jgi:hypothetical protein
MTEVSIPLYLSRSGVLTPVVARRVVEERGEEIGGDLVAFREEGGLARMFQ